ncbi:MAG: PorV/PorQ family protein [Gemmatimonadetes bacterium]|nr:UPF0164 family protein [Gemmatimonadota bacterium]NIQ54766.1 UPF0164 family protein [Gemmatimonadota bacterium]NIU74975.1 PorV/PorQ family protein [Gammaproteobacteria bacterium]NIX44848.1 PorV/PorQ family protein [Gemmatimonadota bacterium]NIY09086.1 PorV/PorQ family protein [Gemmatimonadota bacterium]
MSRRPFRLPRLLALALLGAALVAPPAPAVAQQDECCALLLIPVGARSSALLGAITARAGADAVFRNPAGLADLPSNAFVIHHSDIAADQQIEAFSLLLTPFNSTIGITYQLFDKGDIESTDAANRTIGVLKVRDHLLVGTFSTGLGAGLSAGVSYKVFQQRIDCTGLCSSSEYAAITQAVDAGVRYTPEWEPGLELGIAIVNAGLDVQVENAAQADPFPGRLHLGIAYDVLSSLPTDSTLALRVAVEGRDRLLEPGSPTVAFGLELDIQRAVFVRAGWAPGKGLGSGAAVGLELRYDRFDIGVSRSFVRSSLDENEPFQISLGLNF